MSGTECDSCGTSNAPGSRFCRECGIPLTGNARPIFPAGRYTALRWQIDPMDPPPRRDARWTAMVLGASLLVVGALLLAVSAIVASAVAASSGACAGCGAGAPAVWLTWASAPFLAIGGGLLALGVWRAVR